MDLEQEVAVLRKTVRRQALALRVTYSFALVVVALLNITLAERRDYFFNLFSGMMGGQTLPVVTVFVLEWYRVIAIGTGGLTVAAIVLVFSVRRTWPLVLMVMLLVAFIVVHLLMILAFITPIVNMFMQLTE